MMKWDHSKMRLGLNLPIKKCRIKFKYNNNRKTSWVFPLPIRIYLLKQVMEVIHLAIMVMATILTNMVTLMIHTTTEVVIMQDRTMVS